MTFCVSVPFISSFWIQFPWLVPMPKYLKTGITQPSDGLYTWEGSLLNCVTYVLTWLTSLACLRSNVPYMLTCLRANVYCMLPRSYANVSCVLTCSRANVPCVLTCSRTNMPKWSCAITSNNKNKFLMTCII